MMRVGFDGAFGRAFGPSGGAGESPYLLP